MSEHASVLVFRPAVVKNPARALLWIHGGGLIMGNAALDSALCRRVVDELGAVVASVEYRLAPENPFPAALDDCYAGLAWLNTAHDIDRSRIAIGGASAGGGLAAALALLARDRGEIHPIFQLLTYPMLDDRTVDRTDIDPASLRMWSPAANAFGWRSYLGTGPVSALAAPARAQDLAGLPAAWIGVGTNDLFHDEDVTYARRLKQAGVACTLHVVPGAYHGFDAVERNSPVSREFVDARLTALATALMGSGPDAGV